MGAAIMEIAASQLVMVLMALFFAGGAKTQELFYPRVSTIFDGPSSDMWGLAYAPGQNVLYYSRYNSEDIRQYDLSTGNDNLVTDGSFLIILGGLEQPKFLAFDGQNIMFSETSKLRAVSTSGDRESSSTFEDGANSPEAIVPLPDGSVLVADSGDGDIKKWQNGEWSSLDVSASPLGPLAPSSLAYNANDAVIYFAEEGKNLVYAANITSCNSVDCSVSVIAGQSAVNSITDGTGKAEDGGEGTAAFDNIKSMVHDPTSSTLFVGESTAIRAIQTSSPTMDVTTVAGMSTAVLDEPDKPLSGVNGMCILDPNNIAFIDSAYHKIRKLTLVGPPPPPLPPSPPFPTSPPPPPPSSPTFPVPLPPPPPPSPSPPKSPPPFPPPPSPPPPNPLPPPPAPPPPPPPPPPSPSPSPPPSPLPPPPSPSPPSPSPFFPPPSPSPPPSPQPFPPPSSSPPMSPLPPPPSPSPPSSPQPFPPPSSPPPMSPLPPPPPPSPSPPPSLQPFPPSSSLPPPSPSPSPPLSSTSPIPSPPPLPLPSPLTWPQPPPSNPSPPPPSFPTSPLPSSPPSPSPSPLPSPSPFAPPPLHPSQRARPPSAPPSKDDRPSPSPPPHPLTGLPSPPYPLPFISPHPPPLHPPHQPPQPPSSEPFALSPPLPLTPQPPSSEPSALTPPLPSTPQPPSSEPFAFSPPLPSTPQHPSSEPSALSPPLPSTPRPPPAIPLPPSYPQPPLPQPLLAQLPTTFPSLPVLSAPASPLQPIPPPPLHPPSHQHAFPPPPSPPSSMLSSSPSPSSPALAGPNPPEPPHPAPATPPPTTDPAPPPPFPASSPSPPPLVPQETQEAAVVLQLAPRKPWEEAEEEAADPLESGQKLRTVVTRLTASGGEGANKRDPGADVLPEKYSTEHSQVQSQLFLLGSSDVLKQASSGKELNIPLTNRPTPPSQPYVVRYTLDSFGATAEPVLRLVHVDCREGERKCEDRSEDGGTKYTCSTEGVCVGSSFNILAGSDSGNRSRPSIKLKGEQQVEIVQGETYSKCSQSEAKAGMKCERGVEAKDIVQGDLTGGVQVQCFYETPFGDKEGKARADPILFASADLSSCGLDTEVPGTWRVVFKVTNNAGMPSDPESVTRRLRVVEDCSDGLASCESGQCAQDVVQCNNDGESASEGLPSPRIQLRKVPGVPESLAFVPVPRFSTYKACPASEVEALLQAPCEPGADASSGSGEDLTSQVLACPPQECLDVSNTCSMDLKFSVSGISGCDFDTSAEVGTLLPIQLAVIDGSGQAAQVERTVQVSHPCATERGSFYCDGVCLEVRCEVAEQLVRRQDEQVPQIRLLFTEHKPLDTPITVQFTFGWREEPFSRLADGSRKLLQQSYGARDVQELSIAYGFEANSAELEGTAWENPYVKPCSGEEQSLEEAECGAVAEDLTGNEVAISVLGPCSDNLAELSWEEWKAVMLTQSDGTDGGGTQNEEEAGSKCFQQTCSPTAADRAQCPPGRFAYRYQAADVVDRTSSSTIFLRVEQGSKHALNLTVALSCAEGPEQLQQQVDELGVNTALPYMTDLGLKLHTVRQVTLLSPIQVNHTAMHPGNQDNQGMTPLCLSSLNLDVQVGCTLEDQGFTKGPSGIETDGQWCPCNVKWNPDYLKAPLVVDQPYYVTAGLFGPLVSYQLSHPAGSDPLGPSPFCAPITPSSQSELAQIRHEAAKLSLMVDLIYTNIIPMLQKVQRVTVQTEEKFHETNTEIEAKWRALMEMFVEQYLGFLIPKLKDVAGARVEVDLGALDEGSTEILTRLSAELDSSGFDETVYLTSTLSLERLGASPVPESEVGSAVKKCVNQERGGADARFNFLALPQDLSNPQNVSGKSAAVQRQSQAPSAEEQPLQDLAWSGYPSASNLAAATAAMDDSANVWKRMRATTGVQRLVGVRQQQQVLTGAALYQQRRAAISLLPRGDRYDKLCREGGLAVRLSAECGTARAEAILSTLTAAAAAAAEGTTAVVGGPGSRSASTEASQGTGDIALTMPGIGVDPAFVDTSILYNPQVAGRPHAWYNTSLGANELNREGVPFGFFPHNILPGLPLVYPVVLDINLREIHVIRNFQYMKEGAYLDPYATRFLAMKLATYNVEMQLYGFVRVYAHWDDAGVIRAHFKVEALEYRDYSEAGLQAEGMVNRLVTDIMLLLLVVLYCALTVDDAIKSIQAQRRKRETLAALQRQHTSGMRSFKRSNISPLFSSTPRGSNAGQPWDQTGSVPAALQDGQHPFFSGNHATPATTCVPQTHPTPYSLNPRLPDHLSSVFRGFSRFGPGKATSLGPPTIAKAAPNAALLLDSSDQHPGWSRRSSSGEYYRLTRPTDHSSPAWPILPSTLLPPTYTPDSNTPTYSENPNQAAHGRRHITVAGEPLYSQHSLDHQQQQQYQKRHQQQQQQDLWSRDSFSSPLPSAPLPFMHDSTPPSSAANSIKGNKPACSLGPSSRSSSPAPLKAVSDPLCGEKALNQKFEGNRAPAQTATSCQEGLSHSYGHKREMRWSGAENDLFDVGDGAGAEGGESGGESPEDNSSNSSEFETYVDDHLVAFDANVEGHPGKALHYDHKHVVGGKRVAVQQDMYRGIWNFGWMLYEALLCAAMLAAVGVWFYYALGLVPFHAPSERRAIVYDSLEAPARPLMLRRTAAHDAGDGASAGAANASSVSNSAGTEPLPGTAGRWEFGAEDKSGLQELASMHESMEDMSNMKVVYSLVQGGALVLLLARFIQQVSFQPKLSIISGTLLRALPDIVYFVVIVTSVGVMLSVVLVAVFGGQGFAEISTISGGLLVIFRGVIAGEVADDVMEFFRAEAQGANFESNVAASALAWIFLLIRPLVFLFFLVMVMALLLTPYARLRQGARGAPGVQHDLAVLLRWAWRITQGKLSGHAVLGLLQEVLRSRSGHSSGGASLLWRTGSKPFQAAPPGDSAKLPSLKLPSFKPQPGALLNEKASVHPLPDALTSIASKEELPGDRAKLPPLQVPSFKPQRGRLLKKNSSIHPLPETLTSRASKDETLCSQSLPFPSHPLPEMTLPSLEPQASLPPICARTPSYPTNPMQAEEPAGHRPTLRSMKSMYRKVSSRSQAHGLSALMLTAKFSRRSSLGVDTHPSVDPKGSEAKQPQQPACSGNQAQHAHPSPPSSWARLMRSTTQQMAQSFRRASSVAPLDDSPASPAHKNLSQNLSGREGTSFHAPLPCEGHAISSEAARQEARTTGSHRRITWGGSDDVEDELVSRTWGRVQAVVRARWKQEREQARAAARAHRGALARSLLGGHGTTRSFKAGGPKKRSIDTGAAKGACSGRLATLQQDPEELRRTAADTDTAAAHSVAAARLTASRQPTGNGRLTEDGLLRGEQQQQQQQQQERNPRCVAAPARLPASNSQREREGGQQTAEGVSRSSSCSAEDEQLYPSVLTTPYSPLPPPPVLASSCQHEANADPGTPAHTPPQQASRDRGSGSNSSRLGVIQEVVASTEQCITMVEQLQAVSQGLQALAVCVAGLLRVHAERKQQQLQQQHELERRSPASLPDSAPSSTDCNSILQTHNPMQTLSDPLPRIHTATSGSPTVSASVSSLMLLGTAQPSIAAGPPKQVAAEGMSAEAISCPFLPAIHSVQRDGSGTAGAPAVMVYIRDAEAKGEFTPLLAVAKGDCTDALAVDSEHESEHEPEHELAAALPLSTLTPARTASADPLEGELSGLLAMRPEQLPSLQVPQLHDVGVEHAAGLTSANTLPTAAAAAAGAGAADSAEAKLQSMHAAQFSLQVPQPCSVAMEHSAAPSSRCTSSTAAADSAEADLAELQGMRGTQLSLQVPQLRSVVVEHATAPDFECTSPTAGSAAADLAKLQGMSDTQLSLQVPQLCSMTAEHPAADPRQRAAPAGMIRWAEQRPRLSGGGVGSNSGKSGANEAGRVQGQSIVVGLGGAGGGGEVDVQQQVTSSRCPQGAGSMPLLPGGAGEEKQGSGRRGQHRTYSQPSGSMAHPPQGTRHLGGSSTVVVGERTESVESTRVQPGVRGKAVWQEASSSSHFGASAM